MLEFVPIVLLDVSLVLPLMSVLFVKKDSLPEITDVNNAPLEPNLVQMPTLLLSVLKDIS